MVLVLDSQILVFVLDAQLLVIVVEPQVLVPFLVLVTCVLVKLTG